MACRLAGTSRRRGPINIWSLAHFLSVLLVNCVERVLSVINEIIGFKARICSLRGVAIKMPPNGRDGTKAVSIANRLIADCRVGSVVEADDGWQWSD